MSITEQLEAIREDVCDHYCKYSEAMNHPGISKEEVDRIQTEWCETCPLGRL